jgi:hypothetical protein
VGDSTIEVAPQSTAWVAGDDAHGITVLLEQGRVECEIAPRRGRPPFAVEAGDVVVRVIGTHFVVARNASEVNVQVERGAVQVTRGDYHVEVRAGETWPPSTLAAASTTVPVATSTPPAAAAPSAGPSSPPQSPREAYEKASRLEVSRPDVAIAIYTDLVARGGLWGMNALFAKGRLQADRGRREEARRALSEYLVRYPSGPNADDARQLLERLR